jgi:8-oxo-dGTP pyrophosphatase MutT (NUDIX family)
MKIIQEIRQGDLNIRAGIVITNGNLLLCGQPTNMVRNNWKLDIFKGHIQQGESPLNAAIRECYEESNIKFEPWKLTNPIQTVCDGNPLFLFLAKIDEIISVNCLSCSSTFIDRFDGIRKPEVEGYVWINPRTHLHLVQERLRPGIQYYFSYICIGGSI